MTVAKSARGKFRPTALGNSPAEDGRLPDGQHAGTPLPSSASVGPTRQGGSVMSRATPQKRTVGHRARLALALAAIVAAIPLTRAGGDTGPTLQADRPCYTPGERMELTGAGY